MSTPEKDVKNFGGMTLTRRFGGIDIETTMNSIHIEQADLAETIAFMQGDYTWHDAGEDADYAWDLYRNAKTLYDQAEALIKLANAMACLRTWLPGYDANSGTLPWERDDDA